MDGSKSGTFLYKFTENGPSIKYRNFGDNILNFRKERITRYPSFCRKTTLITGGEDGIGVAPPSCKTGTFLDPERPS